MSSSNDDNEKETNDNNNKEDDDEEKEPIKSEDVKSIIAKLQQINLENQKYRDKIAENKEVMDKLKEYIATYMKQQTKLTGIEYSSIKLNGVILKLGGKQRERKKKNERKESIIRVLQEDLLNKNENEKIDVNDLFEKLEEARKGEEKQVDSLKIRFPKKKHEDDDNCV
jgi:hypothetical protein